MGIRCVARSSRAHDLGTGDLSVGLGRKAFAERSWSPGPLVWTALDSGAASRFYYRRGSSCNYLLVVRQRRKSA